jgi:uncharacterized protein (TIGR02421 family)
MPELALEEIFSKIHNGEVFEAFPLDCSFRIKIDEYVPYVCAAIHSGNNIRQSISPFIKLNDKERWYEEDPETYKFIESFPIQLIANDSRYEYDLNRPANESIYTDAWGKEVWKSPLPQNERLLSLEKHRTFYKVCSALIQRIEQQFGGCIVYDFHSFNHRNRQNGLPVFNLGVENIDMERYGKIIQSWKKELNKIRILNINTNVEVNSVFFGRGYFLRNITETFKNTLVLATEIRKIYCNEETGELYPLVITAISNGLKKAVLKTSTDFSKKFTKLEMVKVRHLLASEIDTDIKDVDRELFDIVKNFEILNYINPVNLESEKKLFFRNRCSVNPQFRYKQLIINPFEFKRKLYRLSVESIKDINIQILYKNVIDSYADKIDLINSIGTDKFTYNSLRYFGEPSEVDLVNARFLLSCPSLNKNLASEQITAEEAKSHFEQAVKEYGFSCKVDIAKNIASKVLVLNAKKTIKLRKNSFYSKESLAALINHEIGVHMLTTINARLQPLKLLRIGMPVNTQTQEGLAILSEYLSGCLTVNRLRELALRVIAVSKMVNGLDFCQTFSYMKDISRLDDDAVFYLTARVFRGGGFTKDYLYLKGFREILKYFDAGGSVNLLLIGKTSLNYSGLIHELIERKIFSSPTYITKTLVSPARIDPVYRYLMSAVKEAQN